MKGQKSSFILLQNDNVNTQPAKPKKEKSKPQPSNPFVIAINEPPKKTQTPKIQQAESQQKELYNSTVVDMKVYNIFHIDSIIKEKLNSRISKLPELEQDLQKLLTVLITGENRITAQQQLSMLRQRIKDIENTFELNYYILRSADLISRYKSLLDTENSRSFIFSDKKFYAQESAEKSSLISQYISIAQEYIEIENYKRVINTLTCPKCQSDDMRRNIDEETSFLCSDCGAEVVILDDTPSFKDTDRVNMSNRYTYTRRSHFIDAMKKYQGKHNVDAELLQTITQGLLKEMKMHNLTTMNVTKDHLYMFLSEGDMSSHYENINILYHVITGYPCPDFSYLENSLLELFESQEKALNEVTVNDKNDTRINSINVYYKLYKLLQKLDYPCKRGDFPILKTKTKEDEHDDKMRKAWNVLGWQWIET